MQKPPAPRAGLARRGVEFHQRQRKARREKRRDTADRSDLALDVIERDVAFGRSVKLDNARNGEPFLEFLPDVGAKPIAAAKAQPMRALARGLRRVEEVAGEFADILEQRAVPVGNVVPKTPRGKLVADQHRAAAHQDSAGRDDAADAVIHRQAIVHSIAGPGVHQPGEPKTPLQQPPVTDVGRFRQACRAGGIDQQRAIGDRGCAALGGCEWLS